jgi:hypothetical protein
MKNKVCLEKFFFGCIAVFVLLFLCFPPFSYAGDKPVKSEISIIKRSVWGAAAPVESLLVTHKSNKIIFLTIHHTESSAKKGYGEDKLLRNIQNYHMKTKKWGDIAYHFIIGPSGKIYECRDPKYAGDTATNYDTSGHFLVCFLGDFNKDKPSAPALESFMEFVPLKLAEYGLKPEDVKMHCESAATDCPGKHFKEWFIIEGNKLLRRKLKKE